MTALQRSRYVAALRALADAIEADEHVHADLRRAIAAVNNAAARAARKDRGDEFLDSFRSDDT